MDCKETQVWLNGYIDGQLELAQAVEIERHLAGCAECSRISANYRTLQDSIQAAGLEFRCPDHLRRSIESTIHHELGWRPRRSKTALQWMAIAASLLLFAGVSWLALWPTSGRILDEQITEQVVASHVRSLLADHLTDVASSDRHTVKPWFGGKLDFAPTVIDLSAEGYPLVGGRLDYLEHRPVAALVYHRRKHVINVFVWPSEGTTAGDARFTTNQGYQIVRWTEHDLTYWAVSDLNGSELQQFADLIRGAARADAMGKK